MFVVLAHMLPVHFSALQTGSDFGEKVAILCSANYFFLSLLAFFFFCDIFSLLKAPTESDVPLLNKGDEGQTAEEHFLGEVPIILSTNPVDLLCIYFVTIKNISSFCLFCAVICGCTSVTENE